MINIANSFQEAQQAFLLLKQKSSQERVAFLEEVAKQIELLKETLIPIAAKESNLTEGRITGELGRTLGQIRLFSGLVGEGSWVEAVIDHEDAERKPVPKPDIRRMLRPLGPVVVFGASNFPLAFSTAGGDTISALASGCPVLYKAHPAHPETSRIVAKALQTAVEICQMPKGTFQHIEGGIDTGQELAAHPLAKAIAFTGSFKGGKALFDTCNKRDIPIPVYAEMGSVNPIFTFEAFLDENLESAATAYANSLVLGVGQFCTNPGLVFVPKSHEEAFSNQVINQLKTVSGAPMLHEGICKTYHEALKNLAIEEKLEWLLTTEANQLLIGNPSLAKVKASDWLNEDAFQEEVFGPFAIMVVYDSIEELEDVAIKLKGQLTCTVWASSKELAENAPFLNLLEERCGRLLFKGVPTGVEVGHAMQHGGPFPSTTDSRSTSVGSFAIKRFARPIAYQDMPEGLLPEELKEDNPLQILRMVDGEFIR
ncbi:aldehyde dehydrogenase (NADP(+)) [Cyclobacterium marinum]|uniref:Aldehyde Dehydrogenase n=1 Tax=Cyclobacterium marinum (strain ATCC 25205 / DSM 745 / LMG 13164 / NCIMB 1802) TaxID=880070 RepID=G0IX11_CYCMS|nr:aldehyde dehydrogenase (NADP(+)) [Cyclobacterium marinum]AEL24929.1 Aldehyde Dehydrogenase [Cyclobacterium marinum DSM 745]MBI0401596.1 aldehyde dehydrogenase (NADP(+)) [Cyclobacterium marinum]|tara:strand:+ start:43699 stop:45147 length:1449 start_codon:yes stop_codon:yes gene_type:complete